MVKICLRSKNYYIWIHFLETDEKTPKNVKLLTNIIGAIFASNPISYEPKNIFCLIIITIYIIIGGIPACGVRRAAFGVRRSSPIL